MPHSLVLIFGDTVEAALAFDRDIGPDVPRIVLVDTFKDEAEEALRVAHALGDRLYGIRLDTPAERGRVTADLVHEIRARLDMEGFGHVKIVVSGGLNPERIRYFKDAGAPVDSYAVGSYISGATPIDFTGDIKEIDGRPIAKRGRIPGLSPSPRLRPVDLSLWRDGIRLRVRLGAADARARRSSDRIRAWTNPIADRESAYELLQRGHDLLKKRHYAAAAIVLERAARQEPGKGSILEALGRALYNSGQHERLARDVRGAARDRPVGPLRPLRARPEPQAARPDEGGPDAPPPGRRPEPELEAVHRRARPARAGPREELTRRDAGRRAIDRRLVRLADQRANERP